MQAFFDSKNSSILGVKKTLIDDSTARYDYKYISDLLLEEDISIEEFNFPDFTLLRDIYNDNFKGGTTYLKNYGLLANYCLSQIDKDLTKNASKVWNQQFNFTNSTYFPNILNYRLSSVKLELEGLGKAYGILAISDFFSYDVPGNSEKSTVSARQKILCLLDENLENVYCQMVKFEAINNNNKLEKLLNENIIYQIDVNGDPFVIKGEIGQLEVLYDQLEFTDTELLDVKKKPLYSLPDWAWHSLANNDFATIASSAAIEGAPNFVVTAAIGIGFLIDSGVAALSGLAHEAGWIDWEWKGIPNYIGQGVGLGAAKVADTIPGLDVNQKLWMDVGGVVGDIGSLFVPSSWLGKSIQLSSKGVKVGQYTAKAQKGVKWVLAGKKIKIGSDGIRLARGASNAVVVSDRLKKVIDALNILDDIGDVAKDISDITASQTQNTTGSYIPAKSSGSGFLKAALIAGGAVAIAGGGAAAVYFLTQDGDNDDNDFDPGPGGLSDVVVNSRNITLTVWDCGSYEDGDRIDLKINGQYLLRDYSLKYSSKTVHASLRNGRNSVVVHALNEGTYSPNTACITISNVIQGKPEQTWRLFQGEDASFTITVNASALAKIDDLMGVQEQGYNFQTRFGENTAIDFSYINNRMGVTQYAFNLEQRISKNTELIVGYSEENYRYSSLKVKTPRFMIRKQNGSEPDALLRYYFTMENVFTQTAMGRNKHNTFNNYTQLGLATNPIAFKSKFTFEPFIFFRHHYNSDGFWNTEMHSSMNSKYDLSSNLQIKITTTSIFEANSYQGKLHPISILAEGGLSYTSDKLLFNPRLIYDYLTGKIIGYDQNLQINFTQNIGYSFALSKYFTMSNLTFAYHTLRWKDFSLFYRKPDGALWFNVNYRLK